MSTIRRAWVAAAVASVYLIALAAATGSLLVTGDAHLLELADRAPIHTPVEFVDMLALP